jgi:hypothetical protein
MKQLIISLALFAVITGCVFEPDGLYKVDVKEVKEAPGQIEVNLNFVTDTLLIPATGFTTISYSSPDPMIRMAYFSINQSIIGRIESGSGSFQVSINNHGFSENTPYTLKIELFRSSGSGSLADKLMAEGFLYQKEVILIFVSRDKMAPKITRAYPRQGNMVVEWETYKGAGFRSYHVFNTDFRKIAIITDQFLTFCNDDSQIGYGGEYYVVTVAESDSYRSPVYVYRDNLVPATVRKTNQGEYLIEWGKSKYENNLLGYRVYEYLTEPDKLTMIAFITDPSATGIVFSDPHFPLKTRFFVQPVSIYDDVHITDNSDLYQLASVTPEIWMGERMPGIVYMFFEHPLGQFCYFGDFSRFYKFDTGSGTLVDSLRYEAGHYSVSPDGKTILIGNHLSMHLYDAASMSVIREVPLSSLPEEKAPMQFKLSSAMTGVLFYTSSIGYFFDFRENKILGTFRVDYDASWPAYMALNAEGNFFALSHYAGIENHRVTHLYELSGDSVIIRWSGSTSYFDFDPHLNRFVYFYEQKLHYVALDDFSDQVKAFIPDRYLLSIDWNRNECLTLNTARDLFSVRGLEIGDIKTSIKTQLYYTPDYFFLSNKILFSNYGFETLFSTLNY